MLLILCGSHTSHCCSLSCKQTVILCNPACSLIPLPVVSGWDHHTHPPQTGAGRHSALLFRLLPQRSPCHRSDSGHMFAAPTEPDPSDSWPAGYVNQYKYFLIWTACLLWTWCFLCLTGSNSPFSLPFFEELIYRYVSPNKHFCTPIFIPLFNLIQSVGLLLLFPLLWSF